MSFFFSCSQPFLLMCTPKQPEAHSSQSRQLTRQSTWQPVCMLETALRLCSCPVLPCSVPFPPYPLPSRRPTRSSVQPFISHANACLALWNQAFRFCQPLSLSLPMVLETSIQCEIGSPYATERLPTINFPNKKT